MAFFYGLSFFDLLFFDVIERFVRPSHHIVAVCLSVCLSGRCWCPLAYDLSRMTPGEGACWELGRGSMSVFDDLKMNINTGQSLQQCIAHGAGRCPDTTAYAERVLSEAEGRLRQHARSGAIARVALPGDFNAEVIITITPVGPELKKTIFALALIRPLTGIWQ